MPYLLSTSMCILKLANLVNVSTLKRANDMSAGMSFRTPSVPFMLMAQRALSGQSRTWASPSRLPSRESRQVTTSRRTMLVITNGAVPLPLTTVDCHHAFGPMPVLLTVFTAITLRTRAERSLTSRDLAASGKARRFLLEPEFSLYRQRQSGNPTRYLRA